MSFNQLFNSDPTTSYDEPKKITKPIVEKPKRKQVKNACVNCQKACKKCDDGRPCKRCIKLGITATCRDSDRKERKKGVKRGPYKKRQASNKDKPVYPKLTEESIDELTKPIYENFPQVTSYTQPMASFDQDFYVPSQNLSPTYTNESDETLHFTYGYNTSFTTPPFTAASSPTSMSPPTMNSFNSSPTSMSPPTMNSFNSSPTLLFSTTSPSMLDHQATTTISGNVTPLLHDNFYSWDETLPIGFYPIQYKQQQIQQPFFDFTVPSQQFINFWN